MKKSIMYALITVAVIAIAIVGCDGDFGERSEKMDNFLDKFHYNKEKVTRKFTITYNGNGNTSGEAPIDSYSPYDSGAEVSVLSEGTLKRTGYRFNGWNTQADESGKSYEAGNRFPIFKHDTLYAKWMDLSSFTFKVTVVTDPITGTGASGSSAYLVGQPVNIDAGTPPNGWQFQKWTVTSGKIVLADSTKKATTFTMPDGNVTVTAVFVASGGYMSSFTDSRDGKTYRMVTIGGQTWMAQNLNYLNNIITWSDSSWCYDNDPDNCNIYGRLYRWDAAKTVCPAGWRLPDTTDWNSLVTAVGGSSVAGKKLKAASGWNDHGDYGNKNGNGTDDYGFSAQPGGLGPGNFRGVGSYGNWWTDTDIGRDNLNRDYAWGRSMSYGYDYVTRCDSYQGCGSKNNGFSVRCIKND